MTRISRIDFATAGLTQFVCLSTRHHLRAALSCAVQPFGSLASLDLDAYIDGVERWLSDHTGADALSALVRAAGEGCYDDAVLELSRDAVGLATPTSGTRIILWSGQSGWQLRVVFPGSGSERRAGEIITAAEEQVRLARLTLGACSICGETIATGRRLCADHAQPGDADYGQLDVRPSGALIEWRVQAST